MTEFTIYGACLTLAYLFVAVSVFWVVLRWLDRLANIRFATAVMPKLLASPAATAIYFGARIVAVALVVSAVLS